MTTPVKFQDIPAIQSLFATTARQYRKAQVTLARLPRPDELGATLVTYIAAPDSVLGYLKEAEAVITADKVITRNLKPINEAAGIFNEWQQDAAVFLKNYGTMPESTEFVPYRRKGMLNAIEIDDQVLGLLGSTDGQTAVIATDWSAEGMTVYRGGLLADAGYGIAVDERETYELM